MKSKKKPSKSKKEISKNFLGMTSDDFSRDQFIEGGIIRPAILLVSFIAFVSAMFLLLLQNFKWGGSLVVFSFVLNQYSIYESLTDKASIFRTLNLAFKIVIFIAEIIVFNYILTFLL